MTSELEVSATRMNLRFGKVWKTRSRRNFRIESVALTSEKLRGRVSKDPRG
jgi:hypothetical protein